MTTQQAPHREFTGRHMLLLTVAFFGVIISVNVGMAVLATTSWTGLVVKNSYVASQQFETRRLAHEAQQAAGWNAAFSYADGQASLTVRDGAGDAVVLGAVQLKVNRPVGGHDDQALTLERRADGTYSAAMDLGHGVWDAWIVAPETPLGTFELHQRFDTAGGRS